MCRGNIKQKGLQSINSLEKKCALFCAVTHTKTRCTEHNHLSGLHFKYSIKTLYSPNEIDNSLFWVYQENYSYK